jgi:hypothetical protein
MRFFRLTLLVALAASAAAPQNLFPWPDSNAHWRVMVNVNDYIESRPPAWFGKDKLITDFMIANLTPQTYDQAMTRYNTIRATLESRGLYVGTYMSGTTVYPEGWHKTYPPNSITLDQMPTNARYFTDWPSPPGRKVIDVSDASTRHALQTQIRQLWQEVPAPERFIDNAAFHVAMGDKQPWSAYCENMREIRVLAESQGSRVIFNIAAEVASLSDADTQQLEQAVGDEGISLEMPWSSRVQASPEATHRAQVRYRQLLDSGMAIVLIPVKTDNEKLADWVRTWKKPGDHLYMNQVFWKAADSRASIAVH